jgi:CheY-like chemotaxis protein
MNAPAPTVLVVEDDKDSREMLCEYLRQNGYNAAEAADGQQALGQLDEVRNLCLILLDIMMPVMNGWQFLAQQRTHNRFGDVPVVILTAHPPRSLELAIVEVDRVLTKPIDLVEILKVVQSYCDRPA